MSDKVRILVVGLGNMGVSHANAYHKLDGFEIVGLMSRTIKSRTDIPDHLNGLSEVRGLRSRPLAETKPDAVSINTWPNTHAEYALKAFDAGLPCVHGKADRHQQSRMPKRSSPPPGPPTGNWCSVTSCASIRPG